MEGSKEESSYPTFNIIKGGKEGWLPINEAGQAFDYDDLQSVCLGGLALDRTGGPREITQAERNQLADIAEQNLARNNRTV